MTFVTLAKTPHFEFSPEDLGSPEKMAQSFAAGIAEVQSVIKAATIALRKLEKFEPLVAQMAEGKRPSRTNLVALQRLVRTIDKAMDNEAEHVLYHLAESCRFQLGERFEMGNGDFYEHGVLIETHAQHCARLDLERLGEKKAAEAHAEAVALALRAISWTSEPKDEHEAAIRKTTLDVIEHRAKDHGYPGLLFAAVGITSNDGRPFTRSSEANGYATDVRASWTRVCGADAERDKAREAAERRKDAVSIAQAIGVSMPT
jgi:hypothetical protein